MKKIYVTKRQLHIAINDKVRKKIQENGTSFSYPFYFFERKPLLIEHLIDRNYRQYTKTTYSVFNEGYFKTYSYQVVKDALYNIGFDDYTCLITKTNEGVIFNLIIKTGADYSYLNKVMKAYGYYCSNTNVIPNYENLTNIQYEPKYGNSVEDIKQTMAHLYHISPQKYERRILKNGLIPNSRNKSFAYPDRVYLFSGDITQDELKSCIISLATNATIINNKRHIDIKDDTITKWSVFTIDTNLLQDDIRLYYDANIGNIAFYTPDNISPKSITDVQHVGIQKNIEYLRTQQ